MSNILKLIEKPVKKTSTGIVQAQNADGTYVVNTNGRQRTVRSGISGILVPGAKVLLSETSEETYILGKDNMRRKEQVEILVVG